MLLILEEDGTFHLLIKCRQFSPFFTYNFEIGTRWLLDTSYENGHTRFKSFKKALKIKKMRTFAALL